MQSRQDKMPKKLITRIVTFPTNTCYNERRIWVENSVAPRENGVIISEELCPEGYKTHYIIKKY